MTKLHNSTSLNEHSQNDAAASEQIGRRDLLMVTMGAGALLATGAGATIAADAPGHRHEDHAPKHVAALKAANDCILNGQQCIAHCLVSFREGDMTLADCASSVHEMLPICEAMSYQLAANSIYVSGLSAVCVQACKDCEEECRKHEDKHLECKECADACAKFVTELERLPA